MYQIISGYKTYMLRKHFFNKEKKSVLKNINITVEKGKVTGLIGLNGAGKSTIIKIFTGLTNLTRGKLVIDGIEIKNKKKFMKKINLVTGGERNLYWRLSGYQNLEYFGNLYGIKSLDKKIRELLLLVGLSEYIDVPVEQYSKGMKQRLQIAKGLINNPEYLFLDEPTLGIDQSMARDLQNLIRSISKTENIGILITSHTISDIETTSDYIYLLDNGCLIDEGSISEILFKNNIQHTYKILLKEKFTLEVKNIILSLDLSASIRILNENSIEINSLTDIEYKIHSIFSEKNILINNFIHVHPRLETLIEKRLEK